MQAAMMGKLVNLSSGAVIWRFARLPLACLALIGCQGRADTSTMGLLRAGDPGVCVADDIEATLRGLIAPRGTDSKAYSITFADSSLEAFDRDVTRATCNTMLTINGPSGPIVDRAPLDFNITPSAQHRSRFLVASETGAFQEQLRNEIDLDEERAATQDLKREEDEQLAALVKPGWLIGRWVQNDQGSTACSDGPYDDYARGGRYTDGSMRGSWTLSDQTLTIVGPVKAGSLNIIAATMSSMSLLPADGGGGGDYRRCAKGEMRAFPAAAPAAAPEDLTGDLESLERDAENRD